MRANDLDIYSYGVDEEAVHIKDVCSHRGEAPKRVSLVLRWKRAEKCSLWRLNGGHCQYRVPSRVETRKLVLYQAAAQLSSCWRTAVGEELTAIAK